RPFSCVPLLRRLPRCTPFPYTTLFRSRWDTAQMVESMDYAGYGELLGFKGIRVNDPEDIDAALDEAFAADRPVVNIFRVIDPNRSEEHTSELQSRFGLVCRLLLE